MIRNIVCVLALLSTTAASADVLVAPTADRVSVSVTADDPTAPQIRFDGAGLPSGVYAELLGYLKNDASLNVSDNGFGMKFYRDACDMEITLYEATSFDPEFLTFYLELPVSDFLRSNSGEHESFAFGGKPAACLTEAMKTSGVAASSSFGSTGSAAFYRGNQIMCGEHDLLFKRAGINCLVILK